MIGTSFAGVIRMRPLGTVSAILIMFANLIACQQAGGGVTAFNGAGFQATARGPQPQHLDRIVERVAIHSKMAGLSFFAPLDEIAAAEGFEIRHVEGVEKFVTDLGIPMRGGRLLVPHVNQPALAYARRSAAFLPAITSVYGGRSGRLASRMTDQLRDANQQYAGALGLQVKESEVYFEGGNIIPTQCPNQQGMRDVLFVGLSNVLITAALAHHTGKLPREFLDHIIATMPTPTPAQIDWAENQLQYALDPNAVSTAMRLFSNPFEQAVEYFGLKPEQVFAQNREEHALMTLDSYGVDTDRYLQEQWLSDKTSNDLRARALDLLARMEFALDLIAEAFEVERSNIAVMPQAFYHLDIFMTPGSAGVMLMQDPGDNFGLDGSFDALSQSLAEAVQKALDLGCEVQLSPGISLVSRTGLPTLAVGPNVGSSLLDRYVMVDNWFNGMGGTGPTSSKRFYITNAPPGDSSSFLRWNTALVDVLERSQTTLYLLRHPVIMTQCAGIHCSIHGAGR